MGPTTQMQRQPPVPVQPRLPVVLHNAPEELKTGEMTHGVESLAQGSSPI